MSCNCGSNAVGRGAPIAPIPANNTQRVDRRQANLATPHQINCGSSETCGCFKEPFAQLEPVDGNPTSINLYSSSGNSTVDLKPMIKAGETDTQFCINKDQKQLEYKSEHYHQKKREMDIVELICLWQLMKIEDHGNAEKDPATGDVYMYDKATGQWKKYPLQAKLDSIDNTINQLSQAVENLTQAVANLADRVSSIENLIYDYPNDKTTKIPRGNMIFRYSVDNGANYKYFIKSADETTDNVVQTRVQ